MDAKPIKQTGNARALATILLISGAVFAFLMWILYFKGEADYSPEFISSLPALNAFLNASSSVLLTLGFLAIKRGRRKVHMRFMISGMVSSSLFLISYVVYHSFHGDTPFLGRGFIRPVYFFILISHIILSAVVVPLVLCSLYFALSGKLRIHKKVSRFTFPVWLYVSVTGVLIFFMLKAYS